MPSTSTAIERAPRNTAQKLSVPKQPRGALDHPHHVAAAGPPFKEAVKPCAPQRTRHKVPNNLCDDVADQDDDEEANELGQPLEELVPTAVNAVTDARKRKHLLDLSLDVREWSLEGSEARDGQRASDEVWPSDRPGQSRQGSCPRPRLTLFSRRRWRLPLLARLRRQACLRHDQRPATRRRLPHEDRRQLPFDDLKGRSRSSLAPLLDSEVSASLPTPNATRNPDTVRRVLA